MQAENRHLTPEQARYLTVHGISQNEDGTYSWKFDNYVRSWSPVDVTSEEMHELWGNITCPTLLVYGKESWASNPAEDGRLQYFKTARVAAFEGAGHWVHHDRLEGSWRRCGPSSRARSEKWEPVFGENARQNKNLERLLQSER